MPGGETQNTQLLVTEVTKVQGDWASQLRPHRSSGLDCVLLCDNSPPCLSPAPGDFTSFGVPRQMPPRFLAVLGGCEILFQEIRLQWGDPDPPLTSRSYYGPYCLDEKLEAHRGVTLGPRRTESQGSG